jgi:hypothetical protein
MYVNGANVGTVVQVSGVMYSESIQILKRATNTDTCNANIVRAAGFGTSLSDVEHASLQNIIGAYLLRLDTGNIPMTEYVWSTRPPASEYPGQEITITDVGLGGSRWRSNGTRWVNMHPIVLAALNGPITRDASVSTAESGDVCTALIPGGVMNVNSMIQVLPLATCNNSATNKTLRVKADGTSIGTFILTTVVAEQPLVYFRNIASMSAQKTFTGNASATGSISTAPVATTVNTAADWNLTVTLQAANATNGDTITIDAMTVILC